MKTIIPIILGIFLISVAGAISIYSGESYSINLDKPYAYYIISGNSTDVNLDVSQNGTLATIVFDKYMQSDNFTITFYGEQDEVIGSTSGGGGIFTGNYKINEQILENGYSITIFKGGGIEFVLDNENHLLKLIDISGNTATITISSETETLTLEKGNETFVNLNDDCYYDLSVILNNFGSNWASIKIQKIESEIDGCKAEETPEEIIKDKTTETSTPTKTKNGTLLKVGLLFMVVIAIIIIFYLRRNKKENDK